MTALATNSPISRIAPPGSRPASAIEAMAQRLQVDPGKLFQSLAATAFKGASNEEMLALVVVSNQYRLNPFLKQIYAFPKRGGGIVPIVGIDGWTAIVNSEENFDGCEFLYEDDDTGTPISCTCIMHVKGRNHPVKITEYFAECNRPTEPWKGMPRRMLRHKSYMQAARLAFGLGGIYDEDEAHDISTNAPAAGDVTAAAPQATRAAGIVDRLKKQDAPSPADPIDVDAHETTDAEKMLTPPTWEELAEHGITMLIEPDGIAVQQVEGGLTLRPDGVFADYNGFTVQPGTPEMELVARDMAAKTLSAAAASPTAAPIPSVAKEPAKPAPTTRPRPTPPKA